MDAALVDDEVVGGGEGEAEGDAEGDAEGQTEAEEHDRPPAEQVRPAARESRRGNRLRYAPRRVSCAQGCAFQT